MSSDYEGMFAGQTSPVQGLATCIKCKSVLIPGTSCTVCQIRDTLTICSDCNRQEEYLPGLSFEFKATGPICECMRPCQGCEGLFKRWQLNKGLCPNCNYLSVSN